MRQVKEISQCRSGKKKNNNEGSQSLDKLANVSHVKDKTVSNISNISNENEWNININVISLNENEQLQNEDHITKNECYPFLQVSLEKRQVGGRKKKVNIHKAKFLIGNSKNRIPNISNISNEHHTNDSIDENELNKNFRRLSLEKNDQLRNEDLMKEILCGSFSQGSLEHMLPETAGTQCTTMSIMSIIHSHIKKLSLWSVDDMDEILLKGDKQHQTIIKKRKENIQQSLNKLHLITDPLQYLNVDNFLEISKKIKINEDYFEVLSDGAFISDQYFESTEATENNYDGHLNENELKFVFGMIFPKYSNCVITIENTSMAIMYEMCDDEANFYLFDSHADSISGTSTLHTYKNMDDLNRFLLKKFNSTNRFEVNPLIITKLDDNMEDIEQSETVIDKNEDDEIDHMADDEVLLIAHNFVEPESNKKEISAITFAPGQGKRPIPSYEIENIDELCYPSLFGGYPTNESKKLTYAEVIKFQARNVDGRHRNTTRLLYMAKRKMENEIRNAANIYLRKLKNNKNITAKEVKDKDELKRMINKDCGYVDYGFTKNCRLSPEYMKDRKKHLLSMLRQLGTPHIFLTISLSEMKNPELLALLHENAGHGKISPEDALKLPLAFKMELIRNDPVTIVICFEEMLKHLKKILEDPNGPFADRFLVDFYFRKEFQLRGSVHAHMLLWLNNTPRYDKDESNNDLIKFIDEIITCEYNKKNPLMTFQRHKHTHTCYKCKNSKKVCRFGFPKYVMPQTMILEPLKREDVESGSRWTEIKQSLTKINQKMNEFFKKNIEVGFEQLLSELGMDENSYISAIRTTIRNSTNFLQRSSLEVAINAYNPSILNMVQANIDIQYISNPYACIVYITDYINKGNTGLSKLLRNVGKSLENGNYSIQDKLQMYANSFINGSLITAQEAVYIIFSLPLSESSVVSVFINTRNCENRTRKLKTLNHIESLNDESEDIFENNIFDYYANRKEIFEDICLAEYATEYIDDVVKNKKLYEVKIGERNKNKRKIRKILRHCCFKIDNETEYYRENILLFVPWRNEKDEIENVNQKEIYLQNLIFIERIKVKFNFFTQVEVEDIEKMVNQRNSEEEEEELMIDEELVDFNMFSKDETKVIKKPKNEKLGTKKIDWSKPEDISDENLREMMFKLNDGQREFIMHVLNCFKTGENLPLRIFLSGPAGTGKSFVIKTLYHLLTKYFRKEKKGEVNPDNEVVLLTASTGMAAHLIEGNTLHSAFQINPTTKAISSDITNTLRVKLKDTKLNINDETSMIGANLFNRYDQRLQLLTGHKTHFGDISIILCGDLLQLPPVMDKPIYEVPNINELSQLVQKPPAWLEFKLFELTEVMRQKDDLRFVQALNNLSHGALTDDDIKLLESRVVKRQDINEMVPLNCLRLFSTNKEVDDYNNMRIKAVLGELYVSIAEDLIYSNTLSDLNKQKKLNYFQSQSKQNTQGLPTKLLIKRNIRYVITKNINVSDGLANGTTGILKHISFKNQDNGQDFLEILWFDFQSNKVGNKAKSGYSEFMENEGIEKHLVPIIKCQITEFGTNDVFMIVRKQFPISPAEALTIHKSQGCTYDEICIDLSNSKRVQTSMAYVAYSRVTSLRGLFVIDKLVIPPFIKSSAFEEMKSMRNSRRMKLSYDKDITGNIVKIIYKNINSLSGKLKYIICDPWYRQADILIFGEPYIQENHKEIEIPGFSIVFRLNSNGNQSGLIIYFKNEWYAKNKNIKFHESIEIGGGLNQKFHIILLYFQFKDLHIITGYKSPRTSFNVFKKLFDEIEQKRIPMACDRVILIADLNFNTIENNSPLEVYLKKTYNFEKCLGNQITSSNDTQIDIFAKNVSNCHCNVYETYFSDHKPIFIGISSEGVNHSIEQTSNQPSGQKTEIFSKDLKTFPGKQKFNNDCTKESTAKKLKIDKNFIQKNGNNEIIDADSYDDSHILIRSNEEIEADLLIEIKAEVTTSFTYLTDLTMNYVGKLINDCNNEFYIQNTITLTDDQDRIQAVHDKNDIQFLFEKSDTPGVVGHWVCIYYDYYQHIVYVYDSMNSETLCRDHMNIIKRLYLNINRSQDLKIIFRIVLNQQSNGSACGVYSAAYGVSLALGKEPSMINYKIPKSENQDESTFLRRHLLKMIQESKISLFPEYH